MGVSGIVGGVRRIAALRANALGDFVLALPALEAIKNAYPDATLTLLGREWHAAFLEGRPGPVDEVIVLPPITGVSTSEGGHEAPAGLLARLRERRFDLAVQIHGGGRYSNPFVRALGAGLTVGLRTPEAEPLDRWVRYSYFQHEVLRYLEAAALVGGRTDRVEPSVALTARDEAELAALGELPAGLVALHPGATDRRRQWPPESFAAAADRLGRPVVITGSEAERDLVARVAGAMRSPALPVVGALSIGGLAALYARCDLLISNDTGPRHLAAAVGTATVVIYWCGNLINAGPLTRHRHRPLISWTAACPVCGASGLDLDVERCEHDPSWVADVPLDAVVREAEDIMGTAS
ncbi:glycosyltransferase family 9 protein [Nonomuraea candida]|uniref:glycosyltransferase family 9 protein n=1 Tax=Nonomuraea candida TaxID=359159 RepID=UPI0005BE2A77|nr:glycosyltransferase family 9 protein [Nonomuraea candida]